jgi:hypothetical protein
MHDKIGFGLIGIMGLVSIVALVGKSPTILSNFLGGSAQLWSVAMGGQYTGVGGG